MLARVCVYYSLLSCFVKSPVLPAVVFRGHGRITAALSLRLLFQPHTKYLVVVALLIFSEVPCFRPTLPAPISIYCCLQGSLFFPTVERRCFNQLPRVSFAPHQPITLASNFAFRIPPPQNTRGRLLTIDEVKQVGQKDELLERAAVLENDSRGWFEEDDELEARLAEVRYDLCVNFCSNYVGTLYEAALRDACPPSPRPHKEWTCYIRCSMGFWVGRC